MAQLVMNLPVMQETSVQSLSQQDLLVEKMAQMDMTEQLIFKVI